MSFIKSPLNSLAIFVLFLLAFCQSSCKEFIEPSISKQTLSLYAPGDKIETTSYQQTFWWQPVEDALYYRLQIVSPSFNAPEQFIIDTVVSKDKFTYTLDPGKYQWRVRAENGSSQTAYTSSDFTIYPASLKDQAVQLVAPSAGLFTGNTDIKYEWLKLFGTTQYRLQVDDNNFVDENNMVLNVLTDNLTFTSKLPSDGNYVWRVRAENATELSKWSAVRSFTFDATLPTQVVLISPLDKQVATKPATLRWEKLIDAEKYEVYVYKSNGVTLFASYPQTVTADTHIFNAGDLGETVAWKVRAIDKAGNKGAFSEAYTFTLQ